MFDLWKSNRLVKSTHILLKSIVDLFSKEAAYQMNTQKSVVFPHTNNKISEKENSFK